MTRLTDSTGKYTEDPWCGRSDNSIIARKEKLWENSFKMRGYRGKKKAEKERTKVTQRKQQCCGVTLSSCPTCSCGTVGKKEHVLCLSHCISFHSDTMTWICHGLECSGSCSFVVALLQAQEVLEKNLLGIWNRSSHHNGEVHSSVGVLIRRHCDDKHDTRFMHLASSFFLL